jgi:hypothetical protein
VSVKPRTKIAARTVPVRLRSIVTPFAGPEFSGFGENPTVLPCASARFEGGTPRNPPLRAILCDRCAPIVSTKIWST